MVLTRAQAKNKAAASPEPLAPKAAKQARGKRDALAPPQQEQAPADSPAAGEQQQQREARQSIGKRLSAMGAKLSALRGGKKGPASHPISSLPPSAATSPVPLPAGSPAPDFTIPAAAAAAPEEPPAAQQQAPAVEEQAQQAQQAEAAVPQRAAASVQPRAAPVEPAAAPMQEQPAAAVAPQEQPPAAVQQQAQQPVPAQPQEQPAAAALVPQEQQGQPPVPQPRPEKLLKPLPDVAIPCDKLPDGPEPVQVDVEYVPRAELTPLDDPAAALAALPAGLDSADWVEVLRSLLVLRQLTVHHADACRDQLAALSPLVLKSVRSLRSTVCKTAIMAVADLYLSFRDALLPYTDVGGQLKPVSSLLAQLLLKCASNDKRFVVDEAVRALSTLVDSLSPSRMLPLLLPYAEVHKNMKVRGKAGGAVAAAIARMPPADVAAFGHPRLLQAAAKLVTDNTPDARESAKRLIPLLKSCFADPAVQAALPSRVKRSPRPAAAAAASPAKGSPSKAGPSPRKPMSPAKGGEEAPPPLPPSPWERYCQATLSGSAALAVLKAS